MNEKYIRIIGYLLLVLYIFMQMIRKKTFKIIHNKLDLCILLLTLSTTIPLLFNTYISLHGTLETILQYFFAYSLYLLVRETLQKKPKFYAYIIHTLIILTILIILIGIDGITSHQLTNFLENFGLAHFSNGENRLISVFGYANVLAVYLASMLFLNIDLSLKATKHKTKAIYQTITFIFMIGILLTYSKAIFVLLPIILILYIALIKNRTQKIEIFQNIVISSLLSFLFLFIFEKLSMIQNNLAIWLFLAISILITYLIYQLLENLNLTIPKIITKKNLLIGFIVILMFTTYLIIALNSYDTYPVFTKEVESDYEAKIINSMKGNTTYLLEFSIEAQAPKDIENTYTINVIERDEKNQELNHTEVKFGTFSGIKPIQITTKETTKEIKVEFKSEYPYAHKKLTVNSLFINQKEVPLKYKYLPTKFVEKIKNIHIHYKTIQERIEMIKNAIMLTKEHPLIGIGGNGWEHRYQEVQSYPYQAKYIHSYPAKILLEFGILGIMAYSGIAIILLTLLIQFAKKQNLAQLSIIFALLILSIHTIIDTDMEYTYILTYTFSLLGLLCVEQHAQPKKVHLFSNVLLSMLAIFSIYLSIYANLYDKHALITAILKQRNGLSTSSQAYQDLNTQMISLYQDKIKYEKYNQLENYYNLITYTLNSSYENKLVLLEKCYQEISIFENSPQKIQTLSLIIKEFEKQKHPSYYEMLEKFLNLLLNEYEKVTQPLDSSIQEIYDQIKDSYLLGVPIVNESNIQISEDSLKNIQIEKTREILLYHTHGTESYQSNFPYETYEFYKSLDENFNVIKIGNYLTTLLLEKQIATTHHREYHNYPSKAGTYAKSRQAVEKILQENKNINKIIDIHRDAYSNEEHEATTVEINGEKVAPLRFVIGINDSDSDWLYDLKWVLTMQKMANLKYPGLFKPILIRKEEYNQDLCKYATLIEVGENCNHIEHALNSMKYFSAILQDENNQN